MQVIGHPVLIVYSRCSGCDDTKDSYILQISNLEFLDIITSLIELKCPSAHARFWKDLSSGYL